MTRLFLSICAGQLIALALFAKPWDVFTGIYWCGFTMLFLHCAGFRQGSQPTVSGDRNA